MNNYLLQGLRFLGRSILEHQAIFFLFILDHAFLLVYKFEVSLKQPFIYLSSVIIIENATLFAHLSAMKIIIKHKHLDRRTYEFYNRLEKLLKR
jgi:hypothetical protein